MTQATHDATARFSRRSFLMAAGVTAVLAPALRAAAAAAAADGSPRPNIVWFRSEDNHADFIGAYGKSSLAVTPNIDRLAEEGVLYRNAFSTSPVCAPTKLGVLTGLYEASMGPGQNMRASGKRPAWAVGFATYLQEVGYWTTTSGNTDYNTDIGSEAGYDDSTGNWKGGPAGAPFFALLGTSTTHETTSFTPVPGATDPAAVRLPRYHPDSEIMRRDRAHYMDAITTMDGEVGQLLADLESAGQLENTIVIYSSDHGGVLPRSKRFCYDSGLRIPLIIRFPARWQHLAPSAPGTVYEPPVSSIDAPPTLLGLAGLTAPEYMHGQAFAGPAARPRRYAFSNRNRMGEAIDFVRTVQDGRYHYIRNYMPHLPYGQHVQFMWLQAGMREWERLFLAGELDEVQSRFWRQKPAEEFYDVEADPDEVVNLIDRPEQQGRIRQMRAALDEHMLRINDNGFIPEGMKAEGYDASRVPGAYPLERLMALAEAGLRRDPASLPELLTALADGNDIVRYWAAMGCSVLGSRAATASTTLAAAATNDPSPWVRAQAADALGQAGSTRAAVTALAGMVNDTALAMGVRLQAIWSLARLGSAAADAGPALAVAGARSAGLDDYPSQAARYAARVVTGTYVPAP